MGAWKYHTRNKYGISVHPCIILYIMHGHGFLSLCFPNYINKSFVCFENNALIIDA
jgi:hypothetical protein